MKISAKGIELIKKYEGCKLTAYYCPSGVLTIGYGHTKNVYKGQTITKARAEELLKSDLIDYEVAHKYGDFNQNQFDSLTSFAFNCGVGAMIKVIKSGDITNRMMLYINGSNGVLEGLRKRRKEEVELFNTPIPNVYQVIKENGIATVLVDKLNVRSSPSTSQGKIVASYEKGEKFNYSEIHVTDNYVWLKYISYTGVVRYVSARKIDTGEKYLKYVKR